jgi:hypothetical protein
VNRVLELELWSEPGANALRVSGDDVCGRARNEVACSSQVILALSSLPDPVHCRDLEAAITDGELRTEHFYEFCRSAGLPADMQAESSARAYLSHEYGCPLAWVHLPESDQGAQIGESLASWARLNNVSLVEPHQMFCILPNGGVSELLRKYA